MYLIQGNLSTLSDYYLIFFEMEWTVKTPFLLILNLVRYSLGLLIFLGKGEEEEPIFLFRMWEADREEVTVWGIAEESKWKVSLSALTTEVAENTRRGEEEVDPRVETIFAFLPYPNHHVEIKYFVK